jgi:glycosyltransferase involved in cell wall biosynthesis
MQISVVICTHNPDVKRLYLCLQGLKDQTLNKSRWELILIDNNSTQSVRRLISNWFGLKMRIIKETKLGLTLARLRGIKASRGNLIIFVDDDNILEKTYLKKAIEIAKGKKRWGVWSGSARGKYFILPNPFWRKLERYLCVREIKKEQESKTLFDWEAMPHGAGMVVRRKVARLYARFCEKNPLRRNMDRTGSHLISGGDNDIALCGYKAGFQYAVTPKMSLLHLIPKERIQPGYFLRIIRGSAYSNHLLTEIHTGRKSQVPLVRQVLGLCKRFNFSEPREALIEAYRIWGNLQYVCKSR